VAGIGLDAARRAIRVTVAEGAAGLPLGSPPHVIEFETAPNIAIGSQTPWGLAAPLGALLPGTTAVRVAAGDAAPGVPAAATGRPLVLVVRDVHRHPWLARTLARLLEARPDAIVVEMGVPVTVLGGVHIATFGATRANGAAAAEVIAGSGQSSMMSEYSGWSTT
jgi:beta-N-acetylhexosaminidase